MGKDILLVTGANGLLGSKIIKTTSKYQATIPIHNMKPLHPKSEKLDIRVANDVSRLFQKLKPTTVIHTSAETDVDKCEIEREHAWKTNVEGTRNIAKCCQKVNSKLIVISTDYVFDGKKGFYVEEDKPDPVNYYGITKLEGEKTALSHCDNSAILRTSVLYGWHPWKQNFAKWIINELRHQKEIAIVEDHYNTPTLADNLAEIAIEIAEKDLFGVYHASGKERISRYQFAKQIAKTFDLNSDLIKPVKMSQMTVWTAKRPRDSSLNTSKIQKRLRTKPLNIIDGLNKIKEETKI